MSGLALDRMGGVGDGQVRKPAWCNLVPLRFAGSFEERELLRITWLFALSNRHVASDGPTDPVHAASVKCSLERSPASSLPKPFKPSCWRAMAAILVGRSANHAVGVPRVRVADVGGEEFEEAGAGLSLPSAPPPRE